MVCSWVYPEISDEYLHRRQSSKSKTKNEFGLVLSRVRHHRSFQAVLDDIVKTEMESRVAVLLAEGMSVREIAEAMGRRESTIRSHVKHMFAKHGLSRQVELVRLVLSLANAPVSRDRRRKQP